MKIKLLPGKIKVVLLLLGAVVIGFWAVRIYNLHRYHLEKQTRFMMDTYVTIYAVGPEKTTAPAVEKALDRMQEVDLKFNPLNPRSPLYAFNRQGDPISDPEILEVIRAAVQVSKKTSGAFDITVYPLIELWGFYEDSPRLPGESEIEAGLSAVGYEHLIVSRQQVAKSDTYPKIDLGAIAKGYAVGEAARVLREERVSSALIDAGGDVYALGKKDRNMWKVGIKDPRGDDVLGYLEVEDLAVMGSGDYERFFIKDGTRYHHILDPKTGYPAPGVASVIVIHSNPMLADAMATALFVMGIEKGIALVETIPGLEAVMVNPAQEIFYSSGMKGALKTIPGNN